MATRPPLYRVRAFSLAAFLVYSPVIAGETSELTLFPSEEIAPPSDFAAHEPFPPESSRVVPLDDGMLEDGPIIELTPTGPAPVFDDNNSIAHAFGYNTARSSTTWLPGDDDQFGWLSFENLATLQIGKPGGFVGGFGFHLLDGPVRTEMPPRLFDFTLGYQRREWLTPNLGWDVVFRVGAFSDFEGSVKDGIRFPSHAVGFLHVGPTTTWLLGIDYLDWDGLTLLPVFGAVWIPDDYIRVDAVFPRPRVAMRIMDSRTWFYLGGEIAGGTWAIERNDAWNDNATYRDLRLVLGIETWTDDGISSGLELGYVFDRKLTYRSGIGDYSPGDCMMVRLVGRY